MDSLMYEMIKEYSQEFNQVIDSFYQGPPNSCASVCYREDTVAFPQSIASNGMFSTGSIVGH